MNMIDLKVVKVLSPPTQYQDADLWMVDVIAEAYGRESMTTVMKTTKEEAEKVGVGYIFQG